MHDTYPYFVSLLLSTRVNCGGGRRDPDDPCPHHGVLDQHVLKGGSDYDPEGAGLTQ